MEQEVEEERWGEAGSRAARPHAAVARAMVDASSADIPGGRVRPIRAR